MLVFDPGATFCLTRTRILFLESSVGLRGILKFGETVLNARNACR